MRLFLALLLFTTTTASAESYRWSVGGFYGSGGIAFSDFQGADNGQLFGGIVGYRLSDKWQLTGDIASFSNDKLRLAADDPLFPSSDSSFSGDYRATRFSLLFRRNFFPPDKTFNLEIGLGGGLMAWKINDGIADTVLDAFNNTDSPRKYKASEVITSVALGLSATPNPRFSIHGEFRADYQTGAGAPFRGDYNSLRGRALYSATAGIQVHFGSRRAKPARWTSDSAWSAPPPNVRRPVRTLLGDSDEDGVPDATDRCLSTPLGAVVDKTGCPVDSDRDGVYDGLDDCPGTPAKAAGSIDMYGCPIDSDFDGIPDYLDACPFSPVGAVVDSSGCPIDSDKDGVPDGLDDCPYTLPGVAVDRHGCIDMAIFAKPLILYIDYPPGSFEIDPNSRERLKKLAGLLAVVTDIKLEINGYTDNIGTDVANQKLSEKRAMRVRDYLVTQGVASDRMKAFGRGEINQIASNDTAAGRAKNRRIELVFYR